MAAEYLSDVYEPQGDTGDNWLVYNTGRNVSPNFNFMLRVEGLFDLPCKRVHSFTKANEYEYIQEGGLNDYVHMRRKPVSQPFTFQVERYVGVDYIDPLQPGTDLILPVVLIVCRMQMKGNFTPFRLYTFTGCTVMSKEYGELNAEQSGLLTETTTIGYRELVRMTMPDGIMEAIQNSALKFDFEINKKDKKGNVVSLKKTGKNQSARHPANDDTHEQARVWLGNTGTAIASKSLGDDIEITRADGSKYTVTYQKSANYQTNDGTHQKPDIWLGNSPFRANNTLVNITPESGPAYQVTHKKRAKNQPNEANRKNKTKDPVLWQGLKGKTETTAEVKSTAILRANTVTGYKENNAKRATKVLWEGIKKGEKPKTEIKRANTVDGSVEANKKRATQVLWKGIEEGKATTSTEITRALTRDGSQDKNAERAEQVLWEGIKEGKAETSTEITRALTRDGSAAKNKERAEKVLWPGAKAGEKPPKTLRAMMVQTLSESTSETT